MRWFSSLSPLSHWLGLHRLWRAIRRLDRTTHFSEHLSIEERRLIVVSLIVGVIVWVPVYTLKISVRWLFGTTMTLLDGRNPLWLFVPLLLGAAAMTAVVRFRTSTIRYHDADGHLHEVLDVEGDGLERAIALYFSAEPSLEQALVGQEGVEARWSAQTFGLAGRKLLATLLTLGTGGSGGLGAGVSLIGESMAAGLFKPRTLTSRRRTRGGDSRNGGGDMGEQIMEQFGLRARLWRWWRSTNIDDLQAAQLSGIAAAVSTLLGTPLTAAFFATEIIYRRRPVIEKLVYSLLASLVAFFLTNLASGGNTHIFEIERLPDPPLSLPFYGAIILLSIVISFLAEAFRRARVLFDESFLLYFPNMWTRHLVGAALTGAIALAAFYLSDHPLNLVLGPGENVIREAMLGQLTLRAAFVGLIAKFFATLCTIGSGGSAGLLVPSLFLGTMVATALAAVFGYIPLWLIIPSMTSSLVAIVNVPLAAVFFAVETFGAAYLLPALVALIVTLLFAHETSIYRTQREYAEQREILPGYSVRRMAIPRQWAGRTLQELALRRRFELNVIGLIETDATSNVLLNAARSPVEEGRHVPQRGESSVRFNVSASSPLRLTDMLLIMGEDAKLDALEQRIHQLAMEERVAREEREIQREQQSRERGESRREEAG